MKFNSHPPEIRNCESIQILFKNLKLSVNKNNDLIDNHGCIEKM